MRGIEPQPPLLIIPGGDCDKYDIWVLVAAILATFAGTALCCGGLCFLLAAKRKKKEEEEESEELTDVNQAKRWVWLARCSSMVIRSVIDLNAG